MWGQRHAWNTAPVMARYRELVTSGMTGLEASRAVLAEVQVEGRAPVFPGDNVPTKADVPSRMSPPQNIPGICSECSLRQVEPGRKICSGCRKAAYREGQEPTMKR